MGKSRTAGRRLDPIRVQMAQETQLAKHELAMKMVAERVKVDAEFAADVLRVAGEGLRPEIRKDAEETVAKAKTKALVDKWDKTGLLDGVKEDLGQCNPAVLIESQQKQPIIPDEQCGGDGCLCQNH